MDPTNGYRGLRRRSCSMGLLERTATILPRHTQISSRILFWIVRLERACGHQEFRLARRVRINLRRRTPQTPRVELSVRVFVPLPDARPAWPLPGALAPSRAAVRCSAA